MNIISIICYQIYAFKTKTGTGVTDDNHNDDRNKDISKNE